MTDMCEGLVRHKVRSWRRRSAAETLELALALPLLLVLAFGTIEFGYWFYLEHNFQAAAREGARAAIVSTLGDLAARQAAAEEAADQIMADLKIPKDKYEVDSNQDGDYLTVTVKADWKDIGVETGLFMRLHGGGSETELVDDAAKISGVVKMRIEQ
jgi:Flp pilus assembly protein TadG